MPIPYIVYRGEYFKVDRENARGVFYKTPRFEINVSASANPPVGSNSGGAREGMPKLHPTFEIGPMVRWFLLRGAQSDITLRLPVREVIAVGFPGTRHVGLAFSPSLGVDQQNFPSQGWNASLSLGPRFTDQSYNRYYYEVDQQFAKAGRPTYHVHGGYGGMEVTATLSRRFRKTWVGAFVSVINLAGATFSDSPLVERRTAFLAGFGVSWILTRSDKLVTLSK